MNWYKRQLKTAKRQWTEEELSMVRELIEEGNSFRQISLLFDTDHDSIARLPGMRQLFESSKNKNNDKKVKEIKDLASKGYGLQEMSDSLGLKLYTVKKIVKDHNIPNNNIPHKKIPVEKVEEVKRLYTEGVDVLDISEMTGVNYSTAIYILKREGVYSRKREINPDFNPTQEEIIQIDNWYALPPDGEGRSLQWIERKLGIGAGVLSRWFRKTNRLIRSRSEQVGTQSTRDDMALAKLIWWEEKGGLEGYLQSVESRDIAIRILENFVRRVMFDEKKVGHAWAIKSKYMNIINNHTYPDEVQAPVQPSAVQPLSST